MNFIIGENGILRQAEFASNKYTNSAYWSCAYSPMCLVKAGDVITYSNTADEIYGYYYPFR